MQLKLEILTARSIAGLIYDGRLNHTMVAQFLEENGYDAKLERVENLLEEMSDADNMYRTSDR